MPQFHPFPLISWNEGAGSSKRDTGNERGGQTMRERIAAKKKNDELGITWTTKNETKQRDKERVRNVGERKEKNVVWEKSRDEPQKKMIR